MILTLAGELASSAALRFSIHPTAAHAAEQLFRSFQFGPFLLQPERQLLLRDQRPVRIGGRAFDILTMLIERPGELVSKQDLIARVWPRIFVEEANLKANVANLRRALGERHGAPRFIATVVGRGYRFVGAVRTFASAGADPRCPWAPGHQECGATQA